MAAPRCCGEAMAWTDTRYVSGWACQGRCGRLLRVEEREAVYGEGAGGVGDSRLLPGAEDLYRRAGGDPHAQRRAEERSERDRIRRETGE